MLMARAFQMEHQRITRTSETQTKPPETANNDANTCFKTASGGIDPL